MRAKTVVIAAATVAPVVAQLFGATFTGPLWDKYGGVTVTSTTQDGTTTWVGKCIESTATSKGPDDCPFSSGGRTVVVGPSIYSYHGVSPHGKRVEPLSATRSSYWNLANPTIDNDCSWTTSAYTVCRVSESWDDHNVVLTSQTFWTEPHETGYPNPSQAAALSVTPLPTPSANTASVTDSSRAVNTAMSMSTNTGTGTSSTPSGTQTSTTTSTTTSTENAGIQVTGYAWAMGGAAAAAVLAVL